MSVHKKLMQARVTLQSTKLQKSGHNKFAQYYYFELGDFLPEIQNIFNNLGLCGVISFNHEMATLSITDMEDGTTLDIVANVFCCAQGLPRSPEPWCSANLLAPLPLGHSHGDRGA